MHTEVLNQREEHGPEEGKLQGGRFWYSFLLKLWTCLEKDMAEKRWYKTSEFDLCNAEIRGNLTLGWVL